MASKARYSLVGARYEFFSVPTNDNFDEFWALGCVVMGQVIVRQSLIELRKEIVWSICTDGVANAACSRPRLYVQPDFKGIQLSMAIQ